MSNHTQQPTQPTKNGTSEKSIDKVRLKSKGPKVKEQEATLHADGTITYTDSETGLEKPFIPESMEDYRWAMSEAQILKRQGFEVSTRLFEALTQGKETPYIIVGNPAVFVYPEGQMAKQNFINGLTVDELTELHAKKIRKEEAEAHAKKEQIKKKLEL